MDREQRLTQLGIELGAGRVPIPEEWRWLVPVVVAFITALAPQAKRLPGVG